MAPLGKIYQFVCKQPSKRSVLLLAVFLVMLVYITVQDFAYPYDHNGAFDIANLVEIEEAREGVNENQNAYPDNAETGRYCKINDVTKPYNADFKCVKTATRPSATVCLYDEFRDMYISHDLQYTGMWEPHVVADFQEALVRNEDAAVLDIGANIGFYSLLAAKMGHAVVAVEPFQESIWRIHRAVQIDGTSENVIVLHNAVSDSRETAEVRTSGNNQGDHRIRMEHRPCRGSCPATVQTILLDDLLEVANFSSAILKLDIQGFEHRAFQHAKRLLSQIQIQYIFMEWFLMREFYVSENHTSSDKLMVEEMLQLLFVSDYRPYSLTSEGGKPLDPRLWEDWPFDIVWYRLPSSEEQSRIISNHFLNWPP